MGSSDNDFGGVPGANEETSSFEPPRDTTVPVQFAIDDWCAPVWNNDEAETPSNTRLKELSIQTDHGVPMSSKQIDDTPQHSPKIEIVVIKQPEEQHRARYLSEGSRGAIKDRNGSSHCTIKLQGFYRPTRVEMFAANGTGDLNPHQFYKLIPVSGKSATTTPCKKVVAHDGVECLEVLLRPENDMTAILDCIGILKICSYNNRQRRQRRTNANTNDSSENLNAVSTRICFRAYVLSGQEQVQVIKSFTEPIRCVQQLGVPEVLKMSLSKAQASGGQEMFIIGRNFDRNTTVLFREYTDSGTLCWTAEAEIQKPFFHQCHIVCLIPEYPNKYRGGTVSVTVKCGQKYSHPSTFIYLPCEEQEDEWCPPGSPRTSIKRSWYQRSTQWDNNAAYDMPYFEYELNNSNGFYPTSYDETSSDQPGKKSRKI
uniref:RHD domain-containing protein n=1 Tax=Bursaphelenchus xylophilus TaxID=6326 RepID=A0A1I7RKX7_BURXY